MEPQLIEQRLYNLENENAIRAQEFMNLSVAVNNLLTGKFEHSENSTKNFLSENFSFIRFTDTRFGKLLYAENDSIIGRSLELYGEWCSNEIDLISQFVSASDVVIDVGANLGHHSRAFSDMVGRDGMVIAFEPNNFNALLLRLNAYVTEGGPIQVINAAASDAIGFAFMTIVEHQQKANYGGSQLSKVGLDNICPLVRLDDLILTKSPSLIKIDVEGHELEVLRGATSLIKKARPVLFVEADTDASTIELSKMIFELDYDIYLFDSFAYRLNNYKQNKYDEWSGIGYSRNIICLPTHLNKKISGLPKYDGSTRFSDDVKRVNFEDIQVITA